MTVADATDQREWDGFLLSQSFRPFLQSFAMGEVYRRIGQEPVRLVVKDGPDVMAICFAHVVPARRGRHLSVPYGPVLADGGDMQSCIHALLQVLARVAKANGCAFIRMSPFWKKSGAVDSIFQKIGARPSPLHLLGEHLWYLPLVEPDQWSAIPGHPAGHASARSAEDIFKNMRATTRNLVRRAQKENVTVTASDDPVRDLPLFLALHEETRRRHGFTPYTHAFFRAQVGEFAKAGNALLYLARHDGAVLAASIHMCFGGETSYHHGASAMTKIPASTLLQWTAIGDALARGDRVYNFWGIAPEGAAKHPFAGVTLFKTGFGGAQLELAHCVDIPLAKRYYVTRGFETLRKWRRGF